MIMSCFTDNLDISINFTSQWGCPQLKKETMNKCQKKQAKHD